MVFTFTHFVVDFCCGFLILWIVSSKLVPDDSIFSLALLYNGCAFALQFLIGYSFDGKNHVLSAILGLVMLLFALCVAASVPYLAALLAGLGNAFFHVGGGIDSLIYSGGKMARCGFFVSSGAVGVGIGSLLGKKMLFSPILLTPAAIQCLVLVLFFGSVSEKDRVHSAESCFSGYAFPLVPVAFIAAALLLSVFIRSFAGFIFPAPWKAGGALIILSFLSSGAGKALGGWFADKFSPVKTGVYSLALSLPFLIFGYKNPVCGIIGLGLFNMTMPITLFSLACLIPKHTGFAFGLTTLCLFLGYIASFLMPSGTSVSLILSALAIILGVVCIRFSVPAKKETSPWKK